MSNPVLTHKRIRIKFEADKFASQRDILTSETPRMYRGNWARFEVCIFWNNEIVNLGNVASLTLAIYKTDRKTKKVEKTVSAADITAIPSADGWTAGIAQHAAFEFTGAEMNWALSDNLTEENFFLVLSCITNHDPGHDITYGTSGFTLVEDAAGTAGTPPTNDPLYYKQEEADARFFQKHADGASFVVKNGQHGYLYCSHCGLYFPLIIEFKNGGHALNIGEGETL